MNLRDSLKIENGRLKIGNYFCSDLVAKFGSPLYVMDAKYMKDVASSYVETMNSYGDGAVAFASKSFCSVATSKLLAKQGMWFDAVSGGEIHVLDNAGVDLSCVIMHGNAKTYSELEYAISKGVGLIVIDNYNEIQRIQEIAEKLDEVQEVLVRVNPCVAAHTYEAVQTAVPNSKFGFNVFGDALEVITKITKNYPNIVFKGLHCHVGSQIYDASAYTQAIDIMTDFMCKLRDAGILCDVLDFGGGFGIYYTNEDPKFTPKMYAEQLGRVCKLIRESFKNKNLKDAFIVSEPGRSIVGEAGITLYTVQGIRDAADQHFVAVDGGMFDNPRHALYESQYEACVVDKADQKMDVTSTICGKCCETGDIVTKNIPLQNAEVDDVVAVFSTGAYNYSMASHYNFNAIPAVVLVDGDKADYIVRPESYDDLIARDIVPEWI